MHNPLSMIQQAWKIRLAFGPEIGFSAPGIKRYDNPCYSNRPFSFAHLSVTGNACDCRCAHCEGTLLKTMIGVTCPEAMRSVVDRLLQKGCRGILVSGAATPMGPYRWSPLWRRSVMPNRWG